MVARIASSFIRFHAPYNLKDCKNTLPLGRCKVKAEEIREKNLSFKAPRGIQLRVGLQKDASRQKTTETLVLDNSRDLYAAFAKDTAAKNTAATKGLKATFKSISDAKFDVEALERAEDEGML